MGRGSRLEDGRGGETLGQNYRASPVQVDFVVVFASAWRSDWRSATNCNMRQTDLHTYGRTDGQSRFRFVPQNVKMIMRKCPRFEVRSSFRRRRFRRVK